MKTFLIVDLEVHDPDAYKGYIEKVPHLIRKHNGKYIIRGGKTEVWEGNWHPHRLIMLEFPDREQATAFLEDPDYQPLAVIRRNSTTSNAILVEGYEDN